MYCENDSRYNEKVKISATRGRAAKGLMYLNFKKKRKKEKKKKFHTTLSIYKPSICSQVVLS